MFSLKDATYLLGKCPRRLYRTKWWEDTVPQKFCSISFNIAYNLLSLTRLHPSPKK